MIKHTRGNHDYLFKIIRELKTSSEFVRVSLVFTEHLDIPDDIVSYTTLHKPGDFDELVGILENCESDVIVTTGFSFEDEVDNLFESLRRIKIIRALCRKIQQPIYCVNKCKTFWKPHFISSGPEFKGKFKRSRIQR